MSKHNLTVKLGPKVPMTCLMGPLDRKVVEVIENVSFFRVCEAGVGYHRYKRIGRLLLYVGVEDD